MPTTPVTPYVPQYITVHLGAPSAAAENVTVSFPEYVKNVASSEIYPTWEPAAIRANILAIISFALNRVYTEYYPSRGYPFNITASTAYDQKFIKGRNIFENISQMVDEIFNSYIRRTGFVEPLAAKFCNGTTTTCDGLSQWGSQAMAEQGADSVTILRNYYGDNIEIVNNAPVMGIRSSYPGTPVRLGDRGEPGGAHPDHAQPHLPRLPRYSEGSAGGRDLRSVHRAVGHQIPADFQPDAGRSRWKRHLV